MHYTYDYLKADTLDRLLFQMNANGQRGYKLVGEIKTNFNGEFDPNGHYSCLMEGASEESAIEKEDEPENIFEKNLPLYMRIMAREEAEEVFKEMSEDE